MTSPLIAQLLLDAQDEFLHTIDHIPAPGRGGALGRLNAPGWVVAHAITSHDSWLTRFAQGGSFEDLDPFCHDWYQRQSEAGWEQPVHIDLDEAREAAMRVFARTGAFLEACDGVALDRPVDTSDTPWEEHQVTAGYLVARGVAHLYAHAGELSVIASLVGAGDARLPGRLERTSSIEAAEAGDHGTPLLTARLFRDARDEFKSTAEALPVPARTGAFERLNSGAFIVAHLAHVDDVFWSRAAGIERDPWLLDLDLANADPEAPPQPDFDEALDAFRRVGARIDPHLQSLSSAGLSRTDERERTTASYLARCAAHTWAHAGELAAIGSLAGMPDRGLPGALDHTYGE
jgi:hypothetical protein